MKLNLDRFDLEVPEEIQETVLGEVKEEATRKSRMRWRSGLSSTCTSTRAIFAQEKSRNSLPVTERVMFQLRAGIQSTTSPACPLKEPN